MTPAEENKAAEFAHLLKRFVPEGTSEILGKWMIHLNFNLKITQARHSKFGDYRPAHGMVRHQISINGNLNPYAFLVTFIHEVAHLTAHVKFGAKIKPHGTEWKEQFRQLLTPFLNTHVFPPELTLAIRKYLVNPAASSCTDEGLYRALKKHDGPKEKFVHLEDIPDQSLFQYGRGRVFKKGQQIRKRYRCQEIATGSIYLFNPLAEVILIQGTIF